MTEMALFLLALAFLALIGWEAERSLRGSARLREQLIRDDSEPAKAGRRGH